MYYQCSLTAYSFNMQQCTPWNWTHPREAHLPSIASAPIQLIINLCWFFLVSQKYYNLSLLIWQKQEHYFLGNVIPFCVWIFTQAAVLPCNIWSSLYQSVPTIQIKQGKMMDKFCLKSDIQPSFIFIWKSMRTYWQKGRGGKENLFGSVLLFLSQALKTVVQSTPRIREQQICAIENSYVNWNAKFPVPDAIWIHCRARTIIRAP